MSRRRAAAALLAAAVFVAPACERPGRSIAPASQSTGGMLDPPALPGALGPNLATVDGGLAASWIEPRGSGHRLRFSRLAGERWSAPVTISEGDDFFANWADFPAVVDLGGGALLAHWLAKTAPDTYAYSIFLARSEDGGASWTALGRLNDDETPTEHGFVSFVREGDEARAFWLDGREMAEGGSMSLRTARVGRQAGPAEILDRRVCECCSTGAAVTTGGAVVVYRDRSEEEIRDISAIRFTRDGWEPPRPVSRDGWRIEGCPVNGPQTSARGETVAVAWFTAAGARPAVRLAFSTDGGRSFGEAIPVGQEGSMGRVDVELDQEGTAWVSWIEAPAAETGAGGLAGTRAPIRVQGFGPEGPRDEGRTLAITDSGRASGVPRLRRLGDDLYLIWVEVGDGPSRLRVSRVPIG